jgi:hypothetical protein
MANKHAPELGMQTVPSLNIAYTKVREAGHFPVLGCRYNMPILPASQQHSAVQASPSDLSQLCPWI